jgi:hypothetical protein
MLWSCVSEAAEHLPYPILKGLGRSLARSLQGRVGHGRSNRNGAYLFVTATCCSRTRPFQVHATAVTRLAQVFALVGLQAGHVLEERTDEAMRDS